MRRMIILALLAAGLQAQAFWLWNGRTHPELSWQTLETEHFRVHFHQGLDSLADRSARVAEQAYASILAQLDLEGWGQTDITITTEDEIINGFATPSDQIFIWARQNEASGGFIGSENWLPQVVTHEFQHVAQFHAQRTWAGLWAMSSVPGWWIEGMAEYMTERWRVGRSDAALKYFTYSNRIEELNAHDDGYAKVLYLAWKYGDSTLVKISSHRMYLDKKRKILPFWYDFDEAFKSATGMKVEDFEGEWKRAMQSYYFGYLAQKEGIAETGEILPLPGFERVREVSVSPDGTRLAILGQRSRQMLDTGLYTMTLDSTKKVKVHHFGVLSGVPAWSPDSKSVTLAEYHRGSHGSLVWDLRTVDLEHDRARWRSRDQRTHHPVIGPDGTLYYTAQTEGEATRVLALDPGQETARTVKTFHGDVQIRHLNLAPDGTRLAFMLSDNLGVVEIATLDLASGQVKTWTDDPAEDVHPVWSEDGRAIIFTSTRNSTPNLYRLDLDSSRVTQMTDVGSGLTSLDRDPRSGKIVAMSLGDVDSLRVVLVDSRRSIEPLLLNLRDRFTAWRTKGPDIALPSFDPGLALSHSEVYPYKSLATFRTQAKLVLPDETGLYGLAVLGDAMGKHWLQGAGWLGWNGILEAGYLSYLNATWRPLLQIYASRNVNYALRTAVFGQTLETVNGGGLMAAWSLGGTRSLRSAASIQTHLRLADRQLVYDDRRNGTLWGESSTHWQESNLGITLAWKMQRPQRDAHALPLTGLGFLFHGERTLPEMWGDLDYQRVWADGFINQTIPKVPLVVYSRIKWDHQAGAILPQDSLGFSNEAPVYFSPGTILGLLGNGVVDMPESYSLRGQHENIPATEILLNTTELRWPLVRELPLNILGVQPRNLTGALFSDLGILPGREKRLHTFGAELKFDVALGPAPLVVMALGMGGGKSFWKGASFRQPASAWEEGGYLRLSLVNPF